MPSRRAGFGRKTLLVVGQLLLVLMVMEVVLRVARDHFAGLDRLLYLPEVSTAYEEVGSLEELLGQSLLGWRPYKGSAGFILNSRSLRTPEYEEDKAPGTYRVVVLGDSFAWASGGTPYGFHWPYLTGRGLEDASGERVEVINLGAPGIGPAFYYRMWQLEGSRLGPDHVVLSLFVGNDLTDEQGSEAAPLGQQGLVDRMARWSLTVRAARALSRLRGLERSSDDQSVELSPEDSPVGSAGQGEPGDESGTERRGGYEVMRYRENFDPNQPSMFPGVYLNRTLERMRISETHNRPALEERVDAVFLILQAIRSEVEETGARFTVVLIPDEYQVSETLRELIYERLEESPENYDLRQAQDEILARCESTGLDCLDLLPEFTRLGATTSLYKPRDTHWNLEGNSLAARLIVEHIASQLPPEEREAPGDS